METLALSEAERTIDEVVTGTTIPSDMSELLEQGTLGDAKLSPVLARSLGRVTEQTIVAITGVNPSGNSNGSVAAFNSSI